MILKLMIRLWVILFLFSLFYLFCGCSVGFIPKWYRWPAKNLDISGDELSLSNLHKSISRFNRIFKGINNAEIIIDGGDFPLYIQFIDNFVHPGQANLLEDKCEIILRAGYNGLSLDKLLWHEIGHCMGLDHDESDYLMSSSGDIPYSERSLRKSIEKMGKYLTKVFEEKCLIGGLC